jgi:hypothetical protein
MWPDSLEGEDVVRITGRALGITICEVLDIPIKGVRSVTIRAAVDEAAIVTIEKYLDLDEDVIRTMMSKVDG